MSMLGSGSGSSDNEPSPKKLKYDHQMSGSDSNSDLDWESTSVDDEILPKKPKILAPITDKQAHLEATGEAAMIRIIWSRCNYILGLCKKLSDKLYLSLLDGVAMLVYLLYEKDDLHRIRLSRIIYDQMKEFWDELEQEFDPDMKKMHPTYEASKCIYHKQVDQDRYPLLNEYDLGSLLVRNEGCQRSQGWADNKPYLSKECYDNDDEFAKSTLYDDIREAIRKVKKTFPRLPVDEYTLLLTEMVRDNSNEWREFVVKKAVDMIDLEVIDGLPASTTEELIEWLDIESSSSSSAHEVLVQYIECCLWIILGCRTSTVQAGVRLSLTTFTSLSLHHGPSQDILYDFDKFAKYFNRYKKRNSSLNPDELLEVAELRRKAEESRFIQRDHLLWAFEERGCGLRSAFKDELASGMDAENHPPYHIYQTALILAEAELEIFQVEHLAFAVIFGKCFDYSEDEVKEMQANFQSFKTALQMKCVSFPKEGLKRDLSDDFDSLSCI